MGFFFHNMKITNSWKAHNGSIWRLDWCNPEFGQLLASCSYDRVVYVWEEPLIEKAADNSTPPPPPLSSTTDTHNINTPSNNISSGMNKEWTKKSQLLDATKSVLSVRFGPAHLGLILASCSQDGHIRFYEGTDIVSYF